MKLKKIDKKDKKKIAIKIIINKYEVKIKWIQMLMDKIKKKYQSRKKWEEIAIKK